MALPGLQLFSFGPLIVNHAAATISHHNNPSSSSSLRRPSSPPPPASSSSSSTHPARPPLPPPPLGRRLGNLILQLGLPVAVTCTSITHLVANIPIPQPPPTLLQRVFSSAPKPPPVHFPALQRFMHANFILSLENVAERRWWTLFSSALNHADARHLLGNLLALVPLTRLATDPAFCISPLDAGAVVLGSAVGCSAATLYLAGPEGALDVHALGASGVVHGLLVYVACMAPRGTWLSTPFVPVSAPASVSAALVVFSELVMLAAARARAWIPGSGPRVGHAGHLGGAAFALVYYWIRHWRLTPRSWSEERIVGRNQD